METMVRIFRPGEESELLTLLAEAHGNHYDAAETRRVSSSARFDPAGCFIAEEQATPVGCVAVTKLPRDKWFIIRYLAIRNAQSRVQVAQQAASSPRNKLRRWGVWPSQNYRVTNGSSSDTWQSETLSPWFRLPRGFSSEPFNTSGPKDPNM